MVRNHVRKTNRGEVPPELMLAAVRRVKKDGSSIRKAAADYNINVRTLTRYCKKIPQDEIDDQIIVRPSTNVGYFPSRKVFSDDDEKELKQFVLQAADACYGLTSKEIKIFAYNLCVAKSIKCPKSWKEKGCAGNDWFTDFLKRHPELKRADSINLTASSSSSMESLKIQKKTESNANLGEASPNEDHSDDRRVETRTDSYQPEGVAGLSFLQDLIPLAETQIEEILNSSSTSQNQEEETSLDSTGPGTTSPSSGTMKRTSFSTFQKKLEASLIKLMNSQIFDAPIDADRSFLDSLIPSIKAFTEDQKLEFRIRVIGIIRDINRQNNMESGSTDN